MVVRGRDKKRCVSACSFHAETEVKKKTEAILRIPYLIFLYGEPTQNDSRRGTYSPGRPVPVGGSSLGFRLALRFEGFHRSGGSGNHVLYPVDFLLPGCIWSKAVEQSLGTKPLKPLEADGFCGKRWGAGCFHVKGAGLNHWTVWDLEWLTTRKGRPCFLDTCGMRNLVGHAQKNSQSWACN